MDYELMFGGLILGIVMGSLLEAQSGIAKAYLERRKKQMEEKNGDMRNQSVIPDKQSDVPIQLPK